MRPDYAHRAAGRLGSSFLAPYTWRQGRIVYDPSDVPDNRRGNADSQDSLSVARWGVSKSQHGMDVDWMPLVEAVPCRGEDAPGPSTFRVFPEKSGAGLVLFLEDISSRGGSFSLIAVVSFR